VEKWRFSVDKSVQKSVENSIPVFWLITCGKVAFFCGKVPIFCGKTCGKICGKLALPVDNFSCGKLRALFNRGVDKIVENFHIVVNAKCEFSTFQQP